MSSTDSAEFISGVQGEWTERVTRWFHEVYESLAPRHGWETQEASRTAWDDVPPENKTLMLATTQEILGRLMLDGWQPPAPASYDHALHCSDCGHFLMPHDVPGHDKWHEEPRR